MWNHRCVGHDEKKSCFTKKILASVKKIGLVFLFIERKNIDLSYVAFVLMVCLTPGFVLNAFELKHFESLSVVKKLYLNVHLASFTLAMPAIILAIFSSNMLDPAWYWTFQTTFRTITESKTRTRTTTQF